MKNICKKNSEVYLDILVNKVSGTLENLLELSKRYWLASVKTIENLKRFTKLNAFIK